MRMSALLGLLAVTIGLSNCRPVADTSSIAVSIIVAEPSPRAKESSKGRRPAISGPEPIIASMTELGLVRLDRDAQVIAAGAARWAIVDDGLDYIFRIDDAAGVSAGDAARRIRAAIRAGHNDPSAILTGAIESVEAVTNTVVEIRLAAPQPDLLIGLAQPGYAIGPRGIMRAEARSDGQTLLQPLPGTDPRPPAVLLRGETAATAIAEFIAGRRALVLGGTFDDLPLVRDERTARGTLRFDPATGLFGLALRDDAGAAAAPAVREALALAIDRDRIVEAIGAAGVAKATTLAGSTIEPPLLERRVTARTLLAGAQPALRISVPNGPGGRALFRMIAEDWAAIGVATTAVAPDAAADLALVDLVTPPGSRAALACVVSAGCDPADRLALINPPYIPIASPVRWSLVAPSLTLFEENGLAAHPLDRLRALQSGSP